MVETLIAAAVIVFLLAVGVVPRLISWFTLLQGGIWIIVFGTILSIAAGLVYHIALYRALQPRGALPRGWYWRPTAYHGALQGPERMWVLPWFFAGAGAFMLVMLGCLAVLMAIWRAPS